MIKDSYISLLIMKYLNGTLSDAEAVKLAMWVSESSENKRQFKEEIQQVSAQGCSSADAAEFWTAFKDGKAKEFEGIKKRKTLRRWGLWAGVASIAAAVVAVLLLWPKESFVTEVMTSPQIAHMPDTHVHVVSSSQKSRTQTVYVSRAGEISRIVLSDGTKVILNSDSKLTLSASFNRNAREVELDGEAFFDVAMDSTRLFVIRCGAESYIVRGTSFNITSYSSDGYSVTTLHEGALEARVNADIIKLVPGEELRVDENASTLSKHKVNVENSTNWITTSRLVFDDTPLRQVANRLSRKYQVTINVQPELGNILYTGVNDDETIEEVLRLLEITSPVPLSFSNINGNYYISKK